MTGVEYNCTAIDNEGNVTTPPPGNNGTTPPPISTGTTVTITPDKPKDNITIYVQTLYKVNITLMEAVLGKGLSGFSDIYPDDKLQRKIILYI